MFHEQSNFFPVRIRDPQIKTPSVTRHDPENCTFVVVLLVLGVCK